MKFGISFLLLKFIVFVCLLIITTFTDLSHQIIPNVISLPGIAAGLLFSIPSLIDAFIGILIGAGILWVFRKTGLWIKKQEMMGWGDVKMAGMIGAFLGIRPGLLALFLGVCFGVVIWSMLILFKVKSRKEYIPFGAFLALGSVIAVFFSQQIISWYLNIFRFS
ncbi:MAG: A24 family peptidase [candidate division WOR-3 bacterium]